jgi:hypothetical protein
MIARGWTEAQRRAYVLADNKLALNAGWEMDLLKVELQDIGDMSFDLGKIGFTVGEMTTFFDEPEEQKEKNIEDPFVKNEMLLTFRTEEQMQDWYNKAEQEGIECKIL